MDVSITLQETDENLEMILRKLAHKQLTPGEWKKLAHLWAFTDEQIKAIEHQYIGDYYFFYYLTIIYQFDLECIIVQIIIPRMEFKYTKFSIYFYNQLIRVLI